MGQPGIEKQLKKEPSVIDRGINHSKINIEMMKSISEESIQSSAKVLQKVADELGIPEDVLVRKIRSLKGKVSLFDLDDATKKIFNSLLHVEDTWNYLEDMDKNRRKVIKAEYPNKFYI